MTNQTLVRGLKPTATINGRSATKTPAAKHQTNATDFRSLKDFGSLWISLTVAGAEDSEAAIVEVEKSAAPAKAGAVDFEE